MSRTPDLPAGRSCKMILNIASGQIRPDPEDGIPNLPSVKVRNYWFDPSGRYHSNMPIHRVAQTQPHSRKKSDRLRGYEFDWIHEEMGQFDWSSHAKAAWPTAHLDLPTRISEDDRMTKILHSLIEKYQGNDLNKVSFPLKEACEKYFEDSVFTEIRKRFPDLDKQVKNAENEIELFKKYNTYNDTRSGLSLELLDEQGRAIVFLTEEFEIVDVAYSTKRAIMVKHQIALSSRVARMEDTLLKCFKEDDLAADKIHFVLQLAYARIAKRKEFKVSRLLSVDLKPASIAPRSGKEFIDLLKQYCATLNDCAHPAAEILTDVFRKAEEASRSRQERKKFAELSRTAIMAHGFFGAYFFLEVLELWEYILIPQDHVLFTFEKDYLEKYLSEKEIERVSSAHPKLTDAEMCQLLVAVNGGHAPQAQLQGESEAEHTSAKKKKNSNKKKKKKKPVSEEAPQTDSSAALLVAKRAHEAIKAIDDPINNLSAFSNIFKINARKEDKKPVTTKSVVKIPEVLVLEPEVPTKSKDEILKELLEMEDTSVVKPQPPPKKKKKTSRVAKKSNKPRDTASSVADDSDNNTPEEAQKEGKQFDALTAPASPSDADGWETVKVAKRTIKETRPSARQRYINSKNETQGPKPTNGKTHAPENPSKPVSKSTDPIQLTDEQTKYRQALLKPVNTSIELSDKEALAVVSTATEAVSKGKRTAKSKPPIPKPQPEVLPPKDIDDLSEFPALAVTKDTTSGKSAGTLRIVSTTAVSSSSPSVKKGAEATTPKPQPTAEKPAQQMPIPEKQQQETSKAVESTKASTAVNVNGTSKPTNGVAVTREDTSKTSSASVTKSAQSVNTKSENKTSTQTKQQITASVGEKKKSSQQAETPSTSSASQKTPSTTKPVKVAKSLNKEQSKPIAPKTEKKVTVPTKEVSAATEPKIDKTSELAVSPVTKTQSTEKKSNSVEDKISKAQPNPTPAETVVIREKPANVSSAVAKATSGVVDTSAKAIPAKDKQAHVGVTQLPRKEEQPTMVSQNAPAPKPNSPSPISALTVESSFPSSSSNQIRFGSLIVEPNPSSLTSSPRTVRWGDSEIDSDEELTETRTNLQPSKLSQEIVIPNPLNGREDLDEKAREFLLEYHQTQTGPSGITAKPGPLLSLKSVFKSHSVTSTASWPAVVDAPAITEKDAPLKSVDIQITVSAPPSPDKTPSELVVTAPQSEDPAKAEHVQALDGASDGAKLLEVITGGKKHQDVIPKGNNTLKVPEPTPTAKHANGNGPHGSYSEAVNGASVQQYMGHQEQSVCAPVSLRTHLFTCPSCEKSIRHRSSILCPGCGPEADVRFCSRDCLFGNHQHWKECGKLPFNRPISDGIIMQYEAMSISKTQWASPQLWRQTVHLWEEDHIDYFIFSTETGELLGRIFYNNNNDYERYRFRLLRDNCISYQDPDQVGLLFRALWHQCEIQGVRITKIELRHLIHLEYGQDIPSVYIPKISDYEWACAGYAYGGYDPAQYGFHATGYYHGHTYLPQFG